MIDSAKVFVNGDRLAELWNRIKQELNAKQDKAERDTATDDEVAEMLGEVFGPFEGEEVLPNGVATDEEVAEMLDGVFGSFSGDGPDVQNIATDEEITEMLNEVFCFVGK